MPKHSRKRRHRSRSTSQEARWLEYRLAEIQKQLDELNNRERVQADIENASGPPLEMECDLRGDLSPRVSFGETNEQNSNIEGSMEPIQDQESNMEENIIQEELEPDLMQILGVEPALKPVEGPPIHKAIESRWADVLKNGLDEETKQDLLKKYLLPENLKCLKVPKLNPEVSAAISSQISRRDERLVKKQELLSTSISTIAQTLSAMLSEREGGNRQYIQSLSDAGRLLCHLQHVDTITRRELISINLNKDLRDTLTDAPVDCFLFGEALEERVKAAKNLEKSSEELKQVKPKVIRKPFRKLNLKGPTPSVQGARVGQQIERAPYQHQMYRKNYQDRQVTKGPRDAPRNHTEKRRRHY